jgi:hypothetical protein
MSTRSLQERSVRNCLTDEGRPLEVGLQERTSNRLSAAVDKSHGRERETKRPGETGSGVRQEEDCKETTIEVSKAIRRCQNRGVITTAGQSSDVTCLRAERHPAGCPMSRFWDMGKQSRQPYAVARCCSWAPRRTLMILETPGSCMVTP